MSNTLLMRRRAMMVAKSKRPDYLRFTAQEDGCSVAIAKQGNPTYCPTEYALNKGVFLNYTYGTIITIDKGEFVEFRRKEGHESNRFSINNFYFYYVQSIGTLVQTGMITTLLDWHGNITSVGSYAFTHFLENGSITGQLVLPDNITKFNDSAFAACKKITGKISFPTGTTLIDSFSFQYCRPSENIVIPSSVTYIGNGAFQNHVSGQSYGFNFIVLPTTPPSGVTNTSFLTNPQNKIYVPYSAGHSILDSYKAASGWSSYSNSIYELDENGEIPV